MAIRLPLQGVADFQDNGAIGAASVNGGIPHNFTIPQDTDNIVVKVTASTAGAGVSVFLQTTDDGGTTWYDVARTSIVSNTSGEANAQWLIGGTTSAGMSTAVNGFPTASILTVGIGNTAASTLAARQVSGLPILGPLARTFTKVEAAVTGVASVRTRVQINSQSASK